MLGEAWNGRDRQIIRTRYQEQTSAEQETRMASEATHQAAHQAANQPTSAIRVECEGPVTTVLLSRPEARNAVDRQTAAELAAAFAAFGADPKALVGVLAGEHGHFCAGADLKAIAAGQPNRVEPEGDGPMGPTRMLLGKPVIAAISGYAVAGGLELALWCDLRVMEEDAVLGVFCRRWGVPLIDGGTVRLPRLIGLSRALDLILTGRPVGAEEALAIGLVNRVVPHGSSRRAAEALARALTRFPQTCLRHDRLSAYEQFDLSLLEAMANEFAHGMASLGAEGVAGAQRFAAGQGRHGTFERRDQ
jgi:enoyl-CoA hydratase